MEQAVRVGPDIGQDTARAIGQGREAARTVLGVAAVKALDLSDQAAEKAQQLARRSRRKYRRRTKKQARKLETRVAAAAKRLQVAMPVDKRRRRGRRVVLFVFLVGGGVAVYMAWRSRQEQGDREASEAGPAPDASGAALEHEGEDTRSTGITSR